MCLLVLYVTIVFTPSDQKCRKNAKLLLHIPYISIYVCKYKYPNLLNLFQFCLNTIVAESQ